ncbi:6-phosphogluconolactonase [Agromyces mediolanus]|uniref:6-phosphogluconolactonase n=1 Tax=Agromyces mediolanus TaxID=41986 RepID=UPI003837F08E
MSTVPEIRILSDADAVAEFVAGRIADGIERARAAGADYVLGCPSGRTPLPTYRALARLVRERGLAISHLRIAIMDDYVVEADGGFRNVDLDAHNSCRRFIRDEVVGALNAAAADEGMAADRLLQPDPADPEAYDALLREAGGIDCFLLASGAGDGHVAFNPPGSPRESGSRVVRLAEQTRIDNLGTFPGFGSLDAVPSHGVTVGIGTIAGLSRSAVMIITTAEKQQAFERITAASAYDPAWPATVIAECAGALVVADRAAAGEQD